MKTLSEILEKLVINKNTKVPEYETYTYEEILDIIDKAIHTRYHPKDKYDKRFKFTCENTFHFSDIDSNYEFVEITKENCEDLGLSDWKYNGFIYQLPKVNSHDVYINGSQFICDMREYNNGFAYLTYCRQSKPYDDLILLCIYSYAGKTFIYKINKKD